MDVGEFHLDGSRTKAVFTGLSYKDKMKLKNDVYICDLPVKKIERMTPATEFVYGNPHFIIDNKVICTGNDMKCYGINQNPKFYLINTDSKTIKCLTPNLDYSLRNSVLSDCRYGNSGIMRVDNGYLYFVITEGTNSCLNRIDAYGNVGKVMTGKGSTDDYDIKNRQVLFIGLRDMRLQELYKAEGIDKVRQLTLFNEWVQKEKILTALEKLKAEAEPGVKIDGWVMKPVKFNKNLKYPAILYIHGGPKTVYGEVFFHEMQYWTGEGYAVFFCNPRGSDGMGNAFADIRGKYGTIDYDDIMKFRDMVLERYPFIDAGRIGVTGGSYGGFMTNWIIGHTNKFKTAVSQASISSWITNFTTSDIGYSFVKDQIAATPWDNPERLWDHSPLKYANRAKTPTLFIHSDEDYRCWQVEGLQMFTALKYHRVESRLFMFKGESHTLSSSGRPNHRIRRLEEISNWFDRFLKK
jgi:Dipeptidyl aminopeptidases/acylaminoacyl-peptidases